MNNKNGNDLPSLTPDRDQVEAYKTKRTSADLNVKSKLNQPIAGNQPSQSSSSWGTTIILSLVILSMGFGGWWFDQRDKKTTAQLKIAEQRIQDLENQLSATGEEMGESAIAIRTKLENLSKKTEELWTQMDRLWASAWRKNQTEIKKLQQQQQITSNKVAEQNKSTQSFSTSIQAISQKQTDAEFTVGILTEEVQASKALKTQVEALSKSLNSIQTKVLGDNKQQVELAGRLSDIVNSQKLLSSRIEQLEKQLEKLTVTSDKVTTTPVTQ